VEPEPALARPQRIRIDPASPRDVEAIADVILKAFREFEPLYTPAGYRATTPTATELAARLAEGPAWMAITDGIVVGTVSAVVEGDEVYVRSMAVRPEARGCGVATQLLDCVTAFARERGTRRLTLKTTPFLADAIRLYERAGFRRTANASDLHGTPLIEMVKDLQ
jgi:GNAT superfamily N-acetyltransferase